MQFSRLQVLSLLTGLFDWSVSSPLTTTTTTVSPVSLTSKSQQTAEISYFWHQKGHDLLPLWPLESPTTTGKSGGTDNRVILIHRISNDYEDPLVNRNPSGATGGDRHGVEQMTQEDNNIFVFCLMFLFGLIICGLMWCLCTVSRHQVDTANDPYGGRRLPSRFGSRRRPNVEVILPYGTRDLPPSYEDIVADFEKLGAQCILPSYKDIMTKCSSGVTTGSIPRQHRPTSSPPPRYTSPVGSFSAQGSSSNPNHVDTSSRENSETAPVAT